MSSECQLEVRNRTTVSGILSHMVVRRAGVPAKGFKKLLFQGSIELIDHYLGLEKSCRAAAGVLSSALEKVIGETSEPPIAAELIQLRRDIYNDRLPKQDLSLAAHDAVFRRLASPEQEQLVLWLQDRRQRENLLRQGAKVLAEDLDGRRTMLRRLLRNPEFQRGLALASPSLSYELEQYLDAPSLDSLPRLRLTERSLVRYLSRSAFKLSPFSSFTRTALMQIALAATPGPLRMRIRRQATLNRSLIASLARCVAEHPELSGHVPVYRAAFTRSKGGKLIFIQRRDVRAMPARMLVPREAIVSLSASRAIEWIIAYLDSRSAPVLMRELVGDLGQSLRSLEQAT